MNNAPEIMILMVSGYRGACKDTVADALTGSYAPKDIKALREHLGRDMERWRWMRVSAADKLREACGLLFDLAPDDFLNRKTKDEAVGRWPWMSPRNILIRMGTKAMRRGFAQDIWVRLLARKMAWMCNERAAWAGARGYCGLDDDTEPAPRIGFVIPDTRFPNEQRMAEYLKEELRHTAFGSRGHPVRIRYMRVLVERQAFGFWRKVWMTLTAPASDAWMFWMPYDIRIQNDRGIADLQKWATALPHIEGCWQTLGGETEKRGWRHRVRGILRNWV